VQYVIDRNSSRRRERRAIKYLLEREVSTFLLQKHIVLKNSVLESKKQQFKQIKMVCIPSFLYIQDSLVR
jgi:hypothetical protein